MTLAGLIAVQVRPFGNGVSESETVPVKPFTGVIVIVDVAVSPGSVAAGEVADTVKSVTINVAVVLWLKAPLVPVIVRV